MIPSYDLIHNALQLYAEDKNNLALLLEAVQTIMNEGTEVMIPLAKPVEEAGQLLLQTQRTDTGKEYVVALTSEEELPAGGCPTISSPLVNYFTAILEMEGIAGIVFNVHSPAPFTMEKKLLKELLKHYGPAGENKIYVQRDLPGAMECQLAVQQGEATSFNYSRSTKSPYLLTVAVPQNLGMDASLEQLGQCYYAAFEEARLHHLHSIAVPPLGLDKGFNLEDSAPLAYKALITWFNQHPNYGLSVIFSCANSASYNTFKGIVEAAQQQAAKK